MNHRLNPDPPRDRHPASPFTASDLPIDDQGRIYHLQIKPEPIAPGTLLVGDPGRAVLISSTLLHDLEAGHEHRGLVTGTGPSGPSGEQATVVSPLKATVAASGIETPSLEMVGQERFNRMKARFARKARGSLPLRGFPAFPVDASPRRRGGRLLVPTPTHSS